MESGVTGIVNLRIYNKAIVRANYYAEIRATSVFVDDKHICDLLPGYYTNVGITPGKHKIVIKSPGFLMAPVTKEFTVDESTTDVYVAFRGRLGKYIQPMIFDEYQYNARELSRETERTTKITFSDERVALKINMWCTVTIDDQPIGITDGNHLRLETTIAKGKHKISFETYYEVGYACIDIKEDYGNLFVPIDECRIIDIQSLFYNQGDSNRQVKCILSRSSQFAGCACTTKITIDGTINVDLRNGGTKEVFISEGNHSIVARANGVYTSNFVVPENCKKVTIYIENMDKIRSIVVE